MSHNEKFVNLIHMLPTHGVLESGKLYCVSW